tara:strand:- start:189 stop:452 length:264 start_codon:yes stop_codon:yes gene_type:complete
MIYNKGKNTNKFTNGSSEPKVIFENGMVLTFEQHQKKVQIIIDTIIRNSQTPQLSLMSFYNLILGGEITWVYPKESLELIMSSINKL